MRTTSCAFSLVLARVLFVLLTYTLLQVHLLRQQKELTRRTRPHFLRRLGPTIQVVALYYEQKFCLISLPEFAEILLLLQDGEPRQKLLRNIQRIKREIYSLLVNPRPP